MTQLQILLFASYADAFGAGAVTVNVPDAATVEDVVAALRALPGGSTLPARPLVAIDRRYSRSPGVAVRAGQEIAIIPPVAGG
jgi:sulfur-carrier protein